MQRMKAIPGVRLSSFAHSPLSQTRLLLLPSSSKHICFVPGQRSSQLYHVRKFTAACYHQETRNEWKRTWSHVFLRPLASLPRAETSRAAPETKELSESRETKEELTSSLAYDATKERDDRSQQPPETTAAAEEEEEAGLACRDDDATKPDKPEMCTADELHYVSVPGTDWRLALWRYLPASDAPKRSHPILMLCGIGTNAFCFDLDSNVSLARYLSGAGFDTWILEVRGAGLSKRRGEPTAAELGSVDGVPSRAVEDTLVSSTIKSATKVSSHMEKHIDKTNEGRDENGVALENDSTVSGGSTRSASTAHESTMAVEEKIGPSTTDAAIMAIKQKEEASAKDEPAKTWNSSMVLQVSEKYKHLLQVDQLWPFSSKSIKKISSLWTEQIGKLHERLASILTGRTSDSLLMTQISSVTKTVTHLLEEGQRTMSPSFSNLQDRLNTTVGSVQEMIELSRKYDWDFDNYLEEDVPAAMEYMRTHTESTDGKVLGVGHSMGGIILYAMLATHGRSEKVGLAGAVTVASSLEYSMSDSSLKLLVPFANPAQLLNIPVVPLGLLMNAVHPLATRPPYPLAWIGYHVSARGMMDPALFQKLVLSNFCTIPMKLLLQLTTVFQPGGLRNRTGSVLYKEGIQKCQVPVLAIAGDHDMICPPPAVIDTLNSFPKGAIYKVFGGPNRHYGHYDLLCGRTAKEEVFPELLNFLEKCDAAKSNRKQSAAMVAIPGQ
ncbi:unnamed protein product [Sphagnum jensenii]|uniref:Serine aminopeptidase S33 domain-containing protein n=1 Tax=Sphagnum jensenii TaxID=128206 RepID=A0ABP1AXX7_9BRYO